MCGIFYLRYDSRVKAMEVDERPTEQYSDIGGLDQQIQEVILSCIRITVFFLCVTVESQLGY